MTTAAFSTEHMIGTMRHLLGQEGKPFDFSMPTLLRDVPSFTSTDTGPGASNENAELGGGANRNS